MNPFKKRKGGARSKLVLPQGVQPALPSRSCGECTACCFALGVPSISKGESQHCENTVEPFSRDNPEGGAALKGCKVYDDRPKECEEFECLWYRMPEIDDSFSSDKSGLVGYSTRPDLIQLRESWPGAAEMPLGLLLIKLLASKCPVILMPVKVPGQEEKRLLFGPPKMVGKLLKDIQERGATVEYKSRPTTDPEAPDQ